MANKFKIAALYVMAEATFGEDPDSDGSSYQFIKALPGATWQPAADVIERPGMVNDLTRQPHVIGAKGGTLNFQLECKGSGTQAGNDIAAVASESSILLEEILGTVTRNTGSQVAAGSTTTVVNVNTGEGARFTQYGMVEIDGERRFITSIATDALTLDRALAGVPANGTTVYAASVFTRANDGHSSLAFVATRDGIQYTLLGCHATVKLAGSTARGTPILEFTVTVGDWEVTAKASLPTINVLTGINSVKGPVAIGSPVAVSGVEELVHAFDFDFGLNFVHQETTAGAQGKSGVELVDSSPNGNIKPYYAASHLTDFYAGTSKSLAFSCGDRTNGFGVYIPQTQFMQPTIEDLNGLVAESISFAVNDNGTGPEYVFSQF